MDELILKIRDGINNFAPNFLSALIIFIVGWVVAYIIAMVAKSILKKTDLDNKFANWMGRRSGQIPAPVNIEEILSNILYYLLLLMVIVAALDTLGIRAISEPLKNFQNQIFVYLPGIFSALLLLGVAWLIATTLKMILQKTLGALDLDNKLNQKISRKQNISQNVDVKDENYVPENKNLPLASVVSNIVYWLVFLLFLPNILGALGLQGLLVPVQNMVNQILIYLPNIAAATIIIVVGWFVARIVEQIVVNLLLSFNVDNFSEKYGISRVLGNIKFSDLIGKFINIVILIPMVIAGLNALNIPAITIPATNVLNKVVNIIPNLLAVIFLIYVAIIIAKFVSDLVVNFLKSSGFDNLIYKTRIVSKDIAGKTPSDLVGFGISFAIILFISVQSLELLGFTTLTALTSQFLVFGGQILAGLIIIAIGLYLANLAGNIVRESNISQAPLLSRLSQILIMVFSIAMGLSQMGVASDIVNLAFGLILGAMAVAFAIAFGFGGRDLAGQILGDLYGRVKKEKLTS
jgi:hypothetical protein